MMYADHTYYTDVVHGDLIPPEDFLACAVKASDFIDYMTSDKIHDLTDIPDEVKRACCYIAEQEFLMLSIDRGAAQGGVIESETVGPHSVKYASAATTRAQAQEESCKIARRYLWRWMYRGCRLV